MLTVAESGLSADEHKRISDWSVEGQRQLYSDEQLWAELLQLNDKEIAILKLIPICYNLAFSGLKDNRFWRKVWDRACVELRGIGELMQLIAWHLTERGDKAIAGWLEANEEFKRRNTPQWQRDAYLGERM